MANINETMGTDIMHKKDFVRMDLPSGDLERVSGLDNLRQAILHRIVTAKGSIIHRPNFGVGLQLFQNAVNSIGNRRSLSTEIVDQLQQDPRVEVVTGVLIDFTDDRPESLRISVKVKPAGYDEIEFQYIPFGGDQP